MPPADSQDFWRKALAVVLIGALIHADCAAAATSSTASTTTPVAVSTAAPIIPMFTHKAKPAPKDSKWGWKEWAIVIGTVLTLGAVAAIETTNHPSGSGSSSSMGMSNM